MTPPGTAQWTFRATRDDSSAACRAIETWAAAFSPVVVMNLVLIVEELFTNTIKYGYGQMTGPVRVEVAPQGATVALTYADQGKPFDSSAASQDWEKNLEQGKVGGLGLRLIQNLACDLHYTRDADWNVLRLVVKDAPT